MASIWKMDPSKKVGWDNLDQLKKIANENKLNKLIKIIDTIENPQKCCTDKNIGRKLGFGFIFLILGIGLAVMGGNSSNECIRDLCITAGSVIAVASVIIPGVALWKAHRRAKEIESIMHNYMADREAAGNPWLAQLMIDESCQKSTYGNVIQYIALEPNVSIV